MDPLYHFVLYGDLFACDPGPGFSTTFYQLVRRDVVRERICSLAHYLHMGRRDGTPAVPTAEDWFTAAQQLGLFDAQWYSATYPDVPQSGMAPGAHYRRFGQMLGRAGSASFDPTRIPVLLRAHPPHMRTPETFLAQYYLDEEHLYSTLQRAGQNGDYDFARTRARQIENRYGPGRALNEARATFYTLSQNWARAKSEWGAFWDSLQTGRHTGRHTSSGIAFDRPSERLDGFQIVEPAQIRQIPSPDTGPEPGKICVYTTLFGDIDDLSPILNPVPGVDYLCFTDRPIDVAGWRTVQVLGETGDNNLNAKIFKIQPHRYLHDYTHSLYVDANTVVLGRLQELIDLCRAGGDFVMWQHPLRMDVYSEANTIVAHRRHSPGKILDQVACYAEDGLPSDTGMFEASFIWRRHSAPIMQDLMAQWWGHICRFSKRDQLSLAYLVWKTGIRPALLSPALGTSRDNVYFFKAPHKNGALPQPRRGLAAPPGKGTPRDIAFVYDPPHAGTGSTVMRGQQLSQIVAQSFGDSRSVHYTPDTDLKDQILILTKGFLKVTTPDQLEALARTNVLIADFVDEPPRLDLISIVDGLMASSLCGYRDYIRRFPQIPTFHVTHHVDTRLPKITPPPGNRLQTGYFGELVNTVLTPEIETRLTAHLVDTSKQNPDWITALPHYNFHYAVRRTRGIDGAKPFLKGFTAAHCGANIIIQKSAGDACFYLGADYPYLLQDDASPDDIVAALDAASASVGSAEWRYGREIMRDVAQRSSQSRVQQEFHALIAAF
ncbi:MAG: glycosyltransferase domain-containing protein [Pseudomonadota bacterium]